MASLLYLNPRGVEALRGNALLAAYLLSCGIGFMMFGYDQAVLGVLSTQPGFLKAIGVSTTDPIRVNSPQY